MRAAVPHLKHVRLVSEGWINKYILTYEMPDGNLYEYESVSRKKFSAYKEALKAREAKKQTPADAICIVPQTADSKLLLIREFRYPLNSRCIAFPAGLIEPGETLESCINRELREETGYVLRTNRNGTLLNFLPQAGISSTGLSDEAVQIVFTQVEYASEANPEPSELIEPFLLAPEDIVPFLAENTLPIDTRAQLILEIYASVQKMQGMNQH